MVNVVGTCDTNKFLDLELLTKTFIVDFDPELFPRLSVKQYHCTAVIFRIGKRNFLGAKSLLDIQDVFIDLNMEI